MNPISLFLTCANKEEARKITTKLLDEKLAACVRLINIKSSFWWEGKRERADEVQLMIESLEAKFDEIEMVVRQLHSYKTFVLTAYPIIRSSKGVERWLKESIS